MRFWPPRGFLLALVLMIFVGCGPTGDIVGGAVTQPGGGSGDNENTDPQGSTCVIPADEDGLDREVLRLVNDIRLQEGLNQLTWNSLLAEIGEEYACTMITNDFFAHVNPDTGEGPGERAIKGGYAFLTLGENLAGGQPTPQAVVEAWMNSEGHRQNILNPIWEEMGLGVRQGGEWGIYWVQLFGRAP